MRRLCSVLLLTLSGCSGVHDACLLPFQRTMTVTELFFGRDVPGRAELTDSEWSSFAASVIAREFPAGFTVLDGAGQWRDSATQAISRERSKVLLVVQPTSGLAPKIERVRAAYKEMYQQASVGTLTYEACATF
jgi:hypothetical protein